MREAVGFVIVLYVRDLSTFSQISNGYGVSISLKKKGI